MEHFTGSPISPLHPLHQSFRRPHRPCRFGLTVHDEHVDAARAFDVHHIKSTAAPTCLDQGGAAGSDIHHDLRELTDAKNNTVALQKLAMEMPFGLRDMGTESARIEIVIGIHSSAFMLCDLRTVCGSWLPQDVCPRVTFAGQDDRVDATFSREVLYDIS